MYTDISQSTTLMDAPALNLPAGFKYTAAFLAGRPQHKKWDAFSLKHPSMERLHRAKLFSPFDALDGYGDSISSKNVEYVEKICLSDRDRGELDRKLRILARYTSNSRMARKYMIEVRVRYFVPCRDKENFAYHMKGQYIEKAGICRRVDGKSIQVDDNLINLDDVVEITSADERLFDNVWE